MSAATGTSTVHQALATGFIETDNAAGKLNTTNHKSALEFTTLQIISDKSIKDFSILGKSDVFKLTVNFWYSFIVDYPHQMLVGDYCVL